MDRLAFTPALGFSLARSAPFFAEETIDTMAVDRFN